MIGEVLPDKGRGHAEHFAHTGTASGAFIADDDNVAFINSVILNDFETGFFALENTGCAFKEKRAVACEFDDAAFRREVAVENTVTAARFHRVCKLANHVLSFGLRRVCDFCKEAAARNRLLVFNHSGFDKALPDEA